jgi:hypothetical protein
MSDLNSNSANTGELQGRESLMPQTNIFALMTKSDQEIIDTIGTIKNEQKEELVGSKLNSDDDGMEIREQRTLVQRLFGKMEAGSLRGSVFAMSSLALGTGSLALPLRFGQMSFTCALLVLIIGAIIAYWSLTIMIEASKRSKQGVGDYSRIVKTTLGNGMSLLLDIFIAVYIFGILVSYQVMSKLLLLIALNSL